MNTPNPDPKNMAKSLKAALAADGVDISHGKCLEIVARQLGHTNWNRLAAKLKQREVKPLPRLITPDGWQIAGTQAQDYHIGVDPDMPGGPARIVALGDDQNEAGFATMMQSIDAEPYRGKRAMCEAEIRCIDTSGLVTIWMRVDDENKKALSFDNMEMRKENGAIRGTKGWSKRQVVLDVPETAASIHFGFFLKGGGHGEARNFTLSEAPDDVHNTNFARNLLPSPMNLNFAQRSLRL